MTFFFLCTSTVYHAYLSLSSHTLEYLRFHANDMDVKIYAYEKQSLAAAKRACLFSSIKFLDDYIKQLNLKYLATSLLERSLRWRNIQAL